MAGHIQLILQENYPQLGFVGDQVKVRAGFARNFLVPKGIAVPISSRAGRSVAHQLATIQAKRLRMKGEARDEVAKIEQIQLSFTLKFGEHGKSFGSITNRDIAAALSEQGVVVDRKQVRLAEPIRSAGEHTVEIKLHAEVSAQIKLHIDAERAPRTAKSHAKREAADEALVQEEADASELQQPDAEGEQE